MKDIKDEADTCNGYFGEPPVQVVTPRESMTVSKKLLMKEMKDELDTRSGYFAEPPVQVVTLRLSMTVSMSWRRRK